MGLSSIPSGNSNKVFVFFFCFWVLVLTVIVLVNVFTFVVFLGFFMFPDDICLFGCWENGMM